jgi:hypothetical protein
VNDAVAKPKVLRRPPQFSHRRESDSTALVTDPPITEKKNALTVRLPILPWQEDGRFGVALIATIALANLVLALLLTRQPTTEPVTSVITQHATAASMPSATGSDNPTQVTIYSEPEMIEESARRMSLEALSKNDNDFNVSPAEFPVPVARALNDRNQ